MTPKSVLTNTFIEVFNMEQWVRLVGVFGIVGVMFYVSYLFYDKKSNHFNNSISCCVNISYLCCDFRGRNEKGNGMKHLGISKGTKASRTFLDIGFFKQPFSSVFKLRGFLGFQSFRSFLTYFANSRASSYSVTFSQT